MKRVEVNILFMNFGDEGTPFTENIARLYGDNADFQHRYVNSREEALSTLQEWENAIVLAKTFDKDSLTETLTFLKVCKKKIKENTIKVGVFNTIKKKTIEPVLRKMGTSEFLEETIRPKTLKFKIDFWSKTLKPQNEENQNDDFKVHEQSNKNLGNNGQYGNSELSIKFVDGLDVENDCWSIVSKKDCKKVLRRILVRLSGPGPSAGGWSEAENKNNDGKTYWKWSFHEKWKSKFYAQSGAFWYFSGNRPEFDWKTNKWIFSGESPSLFYKIDSENHYKLKFDNSELKIAKPSTFSQALQDVIYETIADETSFEHEDESFHDDFSASRDKEDLGGTLSGNAETEKINNKPLAGDVYGFDDGEFEDLKGQNNYREEKIGGNLQGNGSTDKIEDDPLSGDIYGSESKKKNLSGENNFSENEMDDDLDGYGSSSDIIADPMRGDIYDREKKKEKLKNKNAFQEDEIDGHLKGHAFMGEEEGGDLDGESSTDHLDRSALGGESGFQEDAREGHLRGQNSSLRKSNDNSESREETEEREIFGKKQSFYREPGKNNNSNIDLEQFERSEDDVSTPTTKKTQLFVDSGKNKKKQEQIPRYERAPNEDEVLEDGQLNLDEYETLQDENGEEISLESGEVQVVLVVEDNNGQELSQVGYFEDFIENELVVKLQAGVIQKDMMTRVQLSLNYSSDKVMMNMPGAVLEVEDDEEGFELITLEVQNVDEVKREKFLKLYGKRQENISKFLDQAKGVA